MKAMFAWLFLLASLANVFAVASGQPEESLAIGKISGAEVSADKLCIFFLCVGKNYGLVTMKI